LTRPKIEHIGIIVADLARSVERLRPVFGDDLSWKAMPEHGLRTASFRTANLTIELLQYEGEASFAKGVMGTQLGINHVSAQVDDINATTAELADQGFTVQSGFPTDGAHGKVAFFEPDAVTGLLFEICELQQDKTKPDAPD